MDGCFLSESRGDADGGQRQPRALRRLAILGLLVAGAVASPSFSFAQDVNLASRQPQSAWEAQAESLIDWIVEPGIELKIDPRRSKILRTKQPVSRVSVTDPQILEVVQFSPTEFELIGGRTGQTSLTFWFGEPGQPGEMVRYLVKVSPDEATEDRRKIEYGELEKKVNELFPNSVVILIPVADKLLVKGQARDSEEAAQIMALIRGQAPNLSGGFRSVQLNEGPAAEPFPGGDSLPPSTVINLLHVPGEMQVMLKVRVAELSRSALREMGANFNIDATDFTFDSFLGGTGVVRAVLDADEVRLVLTALSENSYSKILAEPNLVTLSGHPAYFIAGGEFAVPTVVGVEGVGAVSTSFRGFGMQLTFIPTVLDKDRIRLYVAPSFSSINAGLTSQDGIPGLDTRAVSTTVDLREGQWLAIAGLLLDEQSGSKQRVPFIGEIPGLDAFFSNKETKRDETELIILVSPELIRPLEAEEAPSILPGMEVTEPSDFAFFLAGRYEGDPDCHHRSTVWPVHQRQILKQRHEAKLQPDYQRCEGYYIQGDRGFSW